MIQAHSNENTPTPPALDNLESVFAPVNLHDDVARQSFIERCRIGSFVSNVPQDGQTNLANDILFRISTFQDVNTSVSALSLARNGWYYCALRRETRCFVCNEIRVHWRRGDDPRQFHSDGCG